MQFVNMWCCNIMGILYLTTLALGDQPKIVIIGAGASGIAAASKLYQNGFQNITILEAENRFGGRVYTTWFDNSWVDIGAQWVHGETDNIVFELASPFGLLEIPQGTEGAEFTVYNSKGDHIPNSIGGKLIDFFLDVSGDGDFSGNNGSVGEYLTRMVNTEMQKYPSINETLVRQFLKLFEGTTMASDASDNWNEVSMRGYVEAWSCAGNSKINWKDRGFGTILDILLKKYPNPEEELPVLNNTILNSEVTNIDYNSTEGKALIVTSTGQQYIADHVIVTPSLGVLKEQYKTLFTPHLPESKVRTIKGLAFGTVAKIILSFDTPWWPNNSSQFTFIWDDADRQEYENDPDKKWLVDLLGIFTLSPRPRLMYSWVSGESARHMETLSEEQVLNQTFAVINKFLGKSFNITRPTGITRTKWYTKKHFRGCYSYRTLESERSDAWADLLAAPLLVNNKPVVMFAGEATHAHYYGNVHGAIDSGFREADRLIALYPNTQK